MNTTVTAENLRIVAKSDNTYLLINQTETTAAGIQTAAKTQELLMAADAAAIKLYPAAPALTDDQVALLTTSGKKVGGEAITTAGVKVTNAATAAAVTNWYTATASAPSAPTMLTGSARQLTSFTDYVLVDQVYLTVSVGANAAHLLTVTPTFTQLNSGNDISAVKMIITTDDGGFAVITNTNNGTAVDIKGSDTNLTDTTVRIVNIYMYVDGDASPIYTQNAANLKGGEIDLQFDVTPVPAA